MSRLGRADDRQPAELDDDLVGQFRRLGAVIDMPQPGAAKDAVDVMAQNRESILAWLAVETQWRVASGIGDLLWLGLDYSAVDVVLRRTAPDKPDEVFADLMMMEAEALSVFRGQDR